MCVREGSAASMQDAISRRDAELDRLRASETHLKAQLASATRGSGTLLAKMQFELTVRWCSRELRSRIIVPSRAFLTSQSMRKRCELIRVESVEGLSKSKSLAVRVGVHVDRMRAAVLGAAAECEDLRRKYQKEALQRKLLYNKIQELRGGCWGWNGRVHTCFSLSFSDTRQHPGVLPLSPR